MVGDTGSRHEPPAANSYHDVYDATIQLVNPLHIGTLHVMIRHRLFAGKQDNQREGLDLSMMLLGCQHNSMTSTLTDTSKGLTRAIIQSCVTRSLVFSLQLPDISALEGGTPLCTGG